MSTPITRHVLSLPAGSRDECTEFTAVQAAGRATGGYDGEREGENSYRVGVAGCHTVNGYIYVIANMHTAVVSQFNPVF